MSKIALPIARTSYFAEFIDKIPLRQLRLRRKSGSSRAPVPIGPSLFRATYHDHDRASNGQPFEVFMIRPILTVSAGTLASRLLGFARDAMVAALLGAGPVADAFLVAFQMVNVTRRLLSEGALNAALVPAFTRVRDIEGAVAAAAFAGRVLGTISLALVIVTAVLGFAMPLVIATLAPGFAGYATLQLAVDDARLMLPYLAFAGPVTVLMGLLNAQHRFALTAFSPLLFNLALIAVMAALLIRPPADFSAALVLAGMVGIAGLLQLLVLALHPGGRLATPLRAAFDAEMRGFLAKAGPGMVASCAPQLLIIAGAVIASTSPSAVSWLYFANRLIELPLGIVGVAIGTVLVPQLTRAVQGCDHAAVVEAESRGLELAVGLALPATLGLIVLSRPIVHLLFEHGAFTAADTTATARALALLALGLPAHVLVKALSPAFFARDNTHTPLLATLAGLAVALGAALLLRPWLGTTAIATGIALAAWSSAGVLAARGAAAFGFSVDAQARRRLPLIALAALTMAGMLRLAADFVLPWSAELQGLAQAATLGILIAGGLAAYAVLLTLFGAIDWTGLRRRGG
jgi:putative peptidoglycan lipid II flippase